MRKLILLLLLIPAPAFPEDTPKDGDRYCIEMDKCSTCCGYWPGPANLCTSLAIDCLEDIPPPKCKQWTWDERFQEFLCTQENLR